MPAGFNMRAISSLAVVAVAMLLVFAPMIVVMVLLAVLAIIGVLEMMSLVSRDLSGADHGLGVVLALCPVVASLTASKSVDATNVLLDVSVLLLLILPGVWCLHYGITPEALRTWLAISFSAFYVGWMLAHFEMVRGLASGGSWLAFAILCTWTTDTGAYLVGSRFGSRKLMPLISPGKTVEGAIGAVVLTGIVGLIIGLIARIPLSPPWILVAALAFSVLAQAGDITESFLKRLAGVKDSGTLIPGHGGLLDRIDGLLWVVVAVYYLAYLTL